MPPVMGAAAFLMVEYVGIPYSEIVKHAILPAVLSYVALFYIVHLEAVKAGMTGLPAHAAAHAGSRASSRPLITICSARHPERRHLLRPRLDASTCSARRRAGARWPSCVVAYVALVANRARYPDLAARRSRASRSSTLPDFYETARTGLHFLLPVVVLIWCLMVEEMSPGLSAFWGVVAMVGVVLTQKPLTAFFRRQGGIARALARGLARFRRRPRRSARAT